MPRRVIAVDYTGPDALRIEEVAPLEPGDGQVVIAVRSAAVNPSDAKSIGGRFGADPAKLPLRPGGEVAGVVTAVGEGARGASGELRPGDEVIAYRVAGGWADEVRTAGQNVFPTPTGVPFDEGAGLLLAGVTAWHLLEATGVGEGDRVIVHGASGSVGELVVQLALLRGAHVVGTASEANQELVRGLGAEPVVYGPGLEQRLRELLPGGADAALDTVGTDEAIDASVALTGDPQRVATINGFARGAERGIRMLGGGAGADPGSAIRAAARPHLVELLGQGRLRVRVARAFPLEEARQAVELISSGHPGGKLLLHP